MPTRPKASAVLASEKKSHRTQAELKQRKEAEKELSTGVAIAERSEVKNNPIAHAEFLRVNALLKHIGKNDAIYEPVINRYCTLQAECVDFEKKREKFNDNLDALMDSDTQDDTKYRLEAQMQKTIIDVDKQIQVKRKMLFDIERENCMTISAALRSIPKTTSNTKNLLLEALADGKH